MATKRTSSYTDAEDTHLYHIYLDVSQNPIIGIYQSKDMFWARVESDYNNNKPDFITELRNKRSLQCRMQTILTVIERFRGCLRQIETLKPSGTSEADIMNQVKILLAQDNKYKHGFKFDYVWPILKDMQKFTNNDTATSAFQRESGHFVSSQEDSPTPESPTMASPGLSLFSLNITSDDVEGSSSQRPIGVKKAKFERRVEEQNSAFCDTLKEGQQQFMEVFKQNAGERQRTNDILERKVECRETKIVMMDLNTITDPMKREFVKQQQLKIMVKQARQQSQGSQYTSGSFGDFFNNLKGPGNGLPDY
ncbi:hypothetical protein Dsin_008865 [Dipteronia sinensis]|uniref:No apical meristem-associated C-terminal domain-containing protein n=1 Tax=Dipteronia sinensis TaxID=43782 RepID=A0AAE0AQ76_9ROSI|nr:hypothetical protein Dsin_008865 [Dipteronia sinensis]